MGMQPHQDADFARRLRERARVCGFATDKALADACSVSATTVGKWMRGSSPSLENWRALCHALQCSSDYLLGLADDPTPRHSATPVGEPYHERLTKASEAVSGSFPGEGWSWMLGWTGRPGDERLLHEISEGRPRNTLLHIMDEAHTRSGIDPWELLNNPAIADVIADPTITVGEARAVADCPQFLGGDRSPLCQSPDFWRWQLERLRAAMAGEAIPPMPQGLREATTKRRR